MEVFGFFGGFHSISEEQLQSCETAECESWREFYLQKGYCPLEVTIRWRDVWRKRPDTETIRCPVGLVSETWKRIFCNW